MPLLGLDSAESKLRFSLLWDSPIDGLSEEVEDTPKHSDAGQTFGVPGSIILGLVFKTAVGVLVKDIQFLGLLFETAIDEMFKTGASVLFWRLNVGMTLNCLKQVFVYGLDQLLMVCSALLLI